MTDSEKKYTRVADSDIIREADEICIYDKWYPIIETHQYIWIGDHPVPGQLIRRKSE